MVVRRFLTIYFPLYILPSILGLSLFSHTAYAAVTPFSSYRFAQPTATIKLQGSAYYRGIWRSAITAWNKTGAFTFKIKSTGQITAKTYHNTTTAANIAGQAQLTYSGNEIKSAVAELNTGVLKQYHYSRASRIVVAEHELGHVIGLKHNSSNKSVMYASNRYTPIQTTDILSVRQHYSMPLNTTITVTNRLTDKVVRPSEFDPFPDLWTFG